MTAKSINPWVCGSLILLCVLSAFSSLPAAQDSRSTRSPSLNRHGAIPEGTGLATQQIPSVIRREPLPSISPRQREELLKDNFAKMKKDADELANLAKSLQNDVNKSNAGVMSLEVIEKAKKIEKLAKEIGKRAKGS